MKRFLTLSAAATVVIHLSSTLWITTESSDTAVPQTMWQKYQNTARLDDLPFDIPTDDEIRRGLLVRPRKYWGNQLREKYSMRFLLLGGSNTAHFAGRFTESVAARVAEGLFDTSSYVQDESLDGSGIKADLYKRFEFQDKYHLDNWPNIVCMEFSMNSHTDISYVKMFDQLVHSLTHLWQIQGLDPPEFMILDLFAVGAFYSTKGRYNTVGRMYRDNDKSGTYFSSPVLRPVDNDDVGESDLAAERAEIAKLNPGPAALVKSIDTQGFSRGAEVSNRFATFARFYGIPMISTADAMFPSFTRYFVHSVDGRNDHLDQMWPFSLDGIHISKLGQTLMLEKIIMPMLEAQLQHPFVPGEKRHSLYDTTDIRLFPASNYEVPGVLGSFSSWGHGTNHLKEIVQPTLGWDFVSTLYHEHDGDHVCYGSSTTAEADTPARFSFSYSNRFCSPATPCRLEVGYVHSWNTSYIGDAVCNLFPYDNAKDANSLNRQQPIIPGEGFHIQGNRVHNELIHDTTVHIHELTRNITKGGKYLLECEKEHNSVLQQGRGLLVCFTEVALLYASKT